MSKEGNKKELPLLIQFVERKFVSVELPLSIFGYQMVSSDILIKNYLKAILTIFATAWKSDPEGDETFTVITGR
jgi:hypothetical protein